MADEAVEIQEPTESMAREVVIKTLQEFEYRGANFLAGKFYKVRDWPMNFVAMRIEKRKNGYVVDKVPSGATVLPDPRAGVDKDSAKEAAKYAAKIERESKPVVVPEPQSGPSRSAGPSLASVATTHENLFGGTDTPEGSKPATPVSHSLPLPKSISTLEPLEDRKPATKPVEEKAHVDRPKMPK